MTFNDPNAFLCVYVGRISKEKRIDVIVEAVRGVEGAYLAIIGTRVILCFCVSVCVGCVSLRVGCVCE